MNYNFDSKNLKLTQQKLQKKKKLAANKEKSWHQTHFDKQVAQNF